MATGDRLAGRFLVKYKNVLLSTGEIKLLNNIIYYSFARCIVSF